jgi:hypothetical protein
MVLVFPALALALLALLAGCGGGGGGGGGPTGPTRGIVFTPQGTGGNNTVTLAAGGATSASTLVLEVRANGVQDLYGVSLDLRYPASLLRFSGSAEGGFLAGTGTSFQVRESPAGNLVIGLTRLGGVGGASGSGVLLTLRFDALAAGTGAFTVDGPLAVDSGGGPLSLSWSAGSVQVTL